MALRCLSVFAAVAQPALSINRKVLSSEEADLELLLAVETRQYALLHSHEELADGLTLDASEAPKPSKLLGESKRLGASASLNEEGYKAVAGLASKEAMQAFAERLLAEEGLELRDSKMLQRVMPFYSGECATQSFKALRTELQQATAPHACHAAWVTKGKQDVSLLAEKSSAPVKPQHGDVAPLDQDGYLAVAALKSDDEMKTFIRRLSKSEGLSVMNEGGLSGFARYYSGVCATQSFAALKKELRSVQPVMKTTAISYELPEGESEDELRQRIAAATGLEADQIEIGEDDGSALDTASLRRTMAAQIGVEEERVNVMKLGKEAKVAPAQAAQQAKPAQPNRAPVAKKATKTVVVAVTSAEGVSLADALRGVPMKVHREPVTMVASIPKPQSCGGGWVAPSSK